MSPQLEVDASARQLTLTFADGRVTRYTVTDGALWDLLKEVLDVQGHQALKSALLKGKAGWLDRGWITAETLTEPTPYAERIAAELATDLPDLIAKLKASLREEPTEIFKLHAVDEHIRREFDA